MKLFSTLVALLVLSTAASAQDDVWKKVKVRHPKMNPDTTCTCGVMARDHVPPLGKDDKGNPLACLCGEKEWPGSRVEIVLPNLNSVRGYVIDPQHNPHSRVKPRDLDFTKERNITLDISLEYPNMNGSISFRRADIKSIRILEPLDEATLKKIEEAKAKQRDEIERLEKEYKERIARLDAEQKEAEARAKKDASKEGMKQGVKEAAEKIQKAIDVYDKYPESQGWGPNKMKELQIRNDQKLPFSLDEREFMNTYDLWVLGKRYTEEQKEKSKEPPK